MVIVDSFEKLFYSLAGAAALWLSKVLLTWLRSNTAKRREEVNRIATLEMTNRQLRESLIDHRNAMLESRMWSRDTLPPFIEES